jgi:hypothetical protein
MRKSPVYAMKNPGIVLNTGAYLYQIPPRWGSDFFHCSKNYQYPAPDGADGFRHPDACPDGCRGKSGSSKNTSFLSLTLTSISIFSLLTIYTAPYSLSPSRHSSVSSPGTVSSIGRSSSILMMTALYPTRSTAMDAHRRRR